MQIKVKDVLSNNERKFFYLSIVAVIVATLALIFFDDVSENITLTLLVIMLVGIIIIFMFMIKYIIGRNKLKSKINKSLNLEDVYEANIKLSGKEKMYTIEKMEIKDLVMEVTFLLPKEFGDDINLLYKITIENEEMSCIQEFINSEILEDGKKKVVIRFYFGYYDVNSYFRRSRFYLNIEISNINNIVLDNLSYYVYPSETTILNKNIHVKEGDIRDVYNGEDYIVVSVKKRIYSSIPIAADENGEVYEFDNSWISNSREKQYLFKKLDNTHKIYYIYETIAVDMEREVRTEFDCLNAIVIDENNIEKSVLGLNSIIMDKKELYGFKVEFEKEKVIIKYFMNKDFLAYGKKLIFKVSKETEEIYRADRMTIKEVNEKLYEVELIFNNFDFDKGNRIAIARYTFGSMPNPVKIN